MASVLDHIGETPLVEVTRIDRRPCRLFLKLESANPSGSIKDRPARTMIEAVRKLRQGGGPPPVCIAVHPIFAGDAYQQLIAAGPARIVSTNSVAHETNAIDIAAELGARLQDALAIAERPQPASGEKKTSRLQQREEQS